MNEFVANRQLWWKSFVFLFISFSAFMGHASANTSQETLKHVKAQTNANCFFTGILMILPLV